MIGLGRMGANMAQRLMRGGHKVVGYDPAEAARALLEKSGAQTAASLEQMGAKLKAPRVVWLMVFSFARIGAALAMKVEDLFVQDRRLWVSTRNLWRRMRVPAPPSSTTAPGSGSGRSQLSAL